MALEPGSRLGPYQILSPLGAGGMGEVYRARDTRLDRDVAVKVITAQVAVTEDVRALRARSQDHLEPESPQHLHALRRRAPATARTTS